MESIEGRSCKFGQRHGRTHNLGEACADCPNHVLKVRARFRL